ncbi:MAG: hypothetical protein K8R40_05790 [Anaerolineaceae bacterium]|nr:hypothetical protein [Anaerolineaceae bacterium]
MEPIRIALFDVDGVLITPGGYRRATTDTIRSVLDEMNLAQYTPDEKVFEHFESLGITSEWDMVPLYLCIVLNAAAEQINTAQNWQTLNDAQKELKKKNLKLSFDSYAQQERIGQITKGQPEAPSELIFEAQKEKQFPFKALVGTGILSHLLKSTRSINLSPTTAHFQEHTLGSDLFEARYHIKTANHYENYLSTYDCLALNNQSRKLLEKLVQSNSFKMSIYTARPSMPPTGVTPDHNAAYSPEAEQALKMIAIDKIQMSAFGKLTWLAAKVNLTADQCLKPSPIHPLSAIAAHFTDEITALHWAASCYQAQQNGRRSPVPSFSFPQTIELHVFEDSPGGLIGGNAAAHVLNKLGIDVTLSLWGISKNAKKKTALQAQGGIVFEDVNTAIFTALGKIQAFSSTR